MYPIEPENLQLYHSIITRKYLQRDYSLDLPRHTGFFGTGRGVCKVFKQQVKWNRLFQWTYSISNRIPGISGVAWFFQMFWGVASKSKQNFVFNFHFSCGSKSQTEQSLCATFYLSKFTQPLKSKSNVENISQRGVPFYLLFKDFRYE